MMISCFEEKKLGETGACMDERIEFGQITALWMGQCISLPCSPGEAKSNSSVPSNTVSRCNLALPEQCGRSAGRAPPQPELSSLWISTSPFPSFSGEGLQGFAALQPNGETLCSNCPRWSSTTIQPHPSLVTGGVSLRRDAQDCPSYQGWF